MLIRYCLVILVYGCRSVALKVHEIYLIICYLFPQTGLNKVGIISCQIYILSIKNCLADKYSDCDIPI